MYVWIQIVTPHGCLLLVGHNSRHWSCPVDLFLQYEPLFILSIRHVLIVLARQGEAEASILRTDGWLILVLGGWKMHFKNPHRKRLLGAGQIGVFILVELDGAIESYLGLVVLVHALLLEVGDVRVVDLL